MEFIHNNETLIKIQFNKKMQYFEALTAAMNPKTKKKLQKFGNEYNCFAASEIDCKNKIIDILD